VSVTGVLPTADIVFAFLPTGPSLRAG
jgi:hypothetical protein